MRSGELRLKDVLRSCIHVANDYKVLGGLQQYPWAEAEGQTPLAPNVLAKLRQNGSFGHWNASGGLYGTRAQVSEAKRLLKHALAGQPGTLKFLSLKTLQFAKRFAKPFKLLTGWDVRRTVELIEPVFGLMRGVPTKHALASVYWRKRMACPRGSRSGSRPAVDCCGTPQLLLPTGLR